MSSPLVHHLANVFALTYAEMDVLIRSAPFRYKVFRIPKRRGGGYRTIAQPAREVKLVQRWILKNMLSSLPVHPAATAYMVGAKISYNAQLHAGNAYLLKMDFADFFPSLRPDDLLALADRCPGFPVEPADRRYFARLLFWRDKDSGDLRLSIGAPTSPHVSNILMHEFDSRVAAMCATDRVVYSRYADDLVFSTNAPAVLNRAERAVAELLAGLPYPTRLRLNPEKTVHSSRRHRRRVTGLILANSGLVSLGRDRKRLIRAQVHRFALGALSPEESLRLRGMISFASDCEPAFVERLRSKYGFRTFAMLDDAKGTP